MWETDGTWNRGWSASPTKVRSSGHRQEFPRQTGYNIPGLNQHAHSKCPMHLPRPPHPLESMTDLATWNLVARKSIALKAYG